MNAGSIRRQGVRVYCSPAETQADTGWIFFREENHHVEINGRRSRRAVTSQPSPTTVPELSQTRERVRRRTIVNRQRSLKPFLAWLGGQGVPLSAVSPVVITKYFTCAVAGRLMRTSISFHVQSLRSFFRYASSRGWCAPRIAESIDAPRLYTHENLPQGPSWQEVKKLLASVTGTSAVQMRSRCAILLCTVYGLRVGEVCHLRLEDINWAEEKMTVCRSKQIGRRTLSAAARTKISLAQKARWAKQKSNGRTRTARPKRTISAAGRKRIAAAQRALWAKVKRQKKAA
jgi:site-specific recombinase XerD